MLFTYTVAEGDEDTDGIAVVADSLVLNGGAIHSTQGSVDASLTHPALQADGHLVDGIAPTVRLDGVDTARVSPAGLFNVFFNFSEPVFGVTNDDVIVTNGSVKSTNRTAATTEHPENIRWVAVIQPAGEGPVSVDLRVGAATDAFGNGNVASSGALNVIAADPVTVEVLQGTSGFSEGGDAEFVLTRSRDSGATTVSLSVGKAGEFMSGTAEISQSAGTTTTLTLTFIGATATLEATFAAGETRKTISFPTEDDALDEPDGTITLTVAANPAQYQYIPGSMSSAVSQVRDNDEPFFVYLAPDHTVRTSLVEGEVAVFRLSHAERGDSPVSAVYLEFTEGLDLLDLGGAAARGYTHLGGGRIRADLSAQYATRFYVPTLANETIGPGGRITLVGSTGEGYVFSKWWMEWTYLLEDDDTPSDVIVDAPKSVTEGDEVRYTITRTLDTGQSRAALTVNLRLEQTGDYVSWPQEHQPGTDGRYTIPLTFAPSSRVTVLTLTTSDDDVAEANGILSALLLPSANNKYTVETATAQNTVLRDNEQPQVSVAVVAAAVTEGEAAQFRFTRSGDNSTAARVGLWVGGLPKIMTDATEAIALTADNADLTQRLSIHGAWVDYILEFAAGEAEKTLSFTTEADNVNEGDGWFGVTIVQRLANPFSIGTGDAQVHIRDDDVPTVTISQVTLPTGAATLEGDTWVGEIGERQALSWVVSCSGNYEYSPLARSPSVSGLILLMEHLQLANHPALYRENVGQLLGNNILNFVSGGLCDGPARTHGSFRRFVGPDGGVETFKLVPKDRQPPIVAEYREAYRQAKAAADAAGTPITQHDIIHPGAATPPNSALINCHDEPRYCPQYRVGTPHKIRLTLVNRDPTILIKAESTTVEEGQGARFIVERLWHDELLRITNSGSETVVALRAAQDGQYITGALPTEITFGRNETSKIIELATVDDSAFGENGSVTIELLPDTTGADLNIAGKYETFEHWAGHTPEGARSDRATIAITNNDTKPGITIAPASAVEGDAGATPTMTFTVSLATAVNGTVEVHWATSDGTAVAGQDYTAATNTVTIPRGATSATFSVTLTGDTADEPDETFNVTISMPGSLAAILGGATATVTGTIIDDDPVSVTIAANTATVEEGEDAVFTLTRSGDPSEELLLTFVFRGTGSQETLNGTFEPGSSTTEVSHTTVDDALVNYPPQRQYDAVLLGDSLGGENVEDDVWSPGTPASATVTVTDNDTLATVTVHPQQAFATERGPIRAIFRRTGGNISRPLVIDYLQFFLRNDAETDFGVVEYITFPANQAEVTSSDFTAGILPGDSIVNPGPASGDLYVPWTLTTLIYGDGGPNGFHRSWEAGIPNTASTVLYDDDVSQGLELHAQYSHRAAIGDQVSITFTVMNTGTVTSGNPITITSVQRDDSSASLDGQSESRVGCTIARAISVGASKSCTATFYIGQADFDTTPLELDATASDGTASSKPFRIYVKILDGILVGFRETDALQVTEGDSSTADLVVTREGSLQEEVQVAYITRPFEGWNPGTAIEGDDYADRSATPGIITFGPNQAEATISFDILQDGLFESRERFEVVLQAPDGVQVAADKGIRRVVILDFRSVNYRAVATLHRTGEGTVMEDSGSVEFAVRLNNAARQLLRYDVSLDPGVRGARAGADFVDPTMTVALAPGELEKTFTVALIDDNKVEDPEDFRVRMTGHIRNPNPGWATLATPTTARVTIVDDDLVEPSEVRLAVTWGGNIFRNVITEATNLQDITVTASFHVETPAGTSRTFVPFTEDTTVRVQFDDPASSADPTDFQAFGVLEVVIAAGETSGSSILQFRPVDDGIDEGNETVILAGSVVANSFVDSSLPVVPASFLFVDNDTRGITLTPGFVMNLMEEGDPRTYTVVLDSQPTDTVTIELQFDETGHLNVSTATLTFNSTNWNVPQVVTVWAEDDGIIEVNQGESIEHEVSGGDYDQVTLGSVAVSIADITVAYIYLEGARALESSGHVEFTIRISPPQPTLSVTVQFSTADGTATGGSDYTSFNGVSRNIPPGGSSDTIRIPITNDTLDEADVETFTLRLAVPSNAKLAGDVAELTATGSIVDDDHTPVLTISGPDGSLSHVPEEAGVPVTFTLTLSGGSSEDVTLDYATGLARGDPGIHSGLGTATEGDDYIAVTGAVTFLPGEKIKTITVQVQDDHISEGTEFFGLNLSNLRNAEFTNQQTKESASVGILDNDTRGVVISRSRIVLEEPTQGATATTDSYSVVLTSQPTATANVAVGGAGDPAVSLDKTSLTFTALNWNTPQTVTITPVRDADAVDEFVTVSHTVTGGDYEGLRADDVGVRVDDSDARDVIVSQSTLTLTEGSADTYTVELASQPIASTTVSISVAGDAQLTIDPTELTFTTSDWNTPQTITVTATHDDDVSNNTATLTHVASGSDYVSVTKTVSVTVTDDADPTVTVMFAQAAYTVPEGETQSVVVTLSADPERSVTIPITRSNQGTTANADYSGVPVSVTFNSGDTSETFSFSATDDDVDDDGKSVVLGFGTTLPSGVSAGGTAMTTISINDDDDGGVSVSEALLTITEGRSGTYTIMLDSQPTAGVTVTVVDPTDNTEVTAEPASLTFSTADWNSPKTVTVNAAQDADAVDETATVTHTVSSTDSSYSSATANSVVITVTDDDDVPVTVSFGQATYTATEGDSATVVVTLSADPERSVTIPITRSNQGTTANADYSGVPASVTFNSGDTSETFSFSATDDTEDDDGESVVLGFGTTLPSGVSAGGTATSTVSITDNDDPAVTVSFGQATYTAAEGDSATVVVTLSADPERSVTIPITRSNQGTTANADYSGVPASVTFNSGDTSETFSFSATDDTEDDDGESVVLGFGTTLPSGVSAGGTATSTVSITDNDDPAVTVSFGQATYTAAEGDSATVVVTLSADPERSVTIPITRSNQGTTANADYSGVPASVTFNAGRTSTSFTFVATQDTEDDDGESVRVGFGSPLPTGVSAATPATTTVSITDDDEPPGREPGSVDRRGTVVTITRVPDGTVIPDRSSLWVGKTVEDGSTFIEGTQALFRLKFEAVGGGPPVGDGVDVDLSYVWQIESPLVTGHGQVGKTTFSLTRVDVWDTQVQIHDNDVGHPDGTVTIRITGCERSGCIIGTPSQITLTIVDDDGGPEAAIPGPPGLPRLVCAPSGDGYDDTAIAVSWKAPDFVGGAPLEFYELRYRQSSRFVQGRLILDPYESWPHGVAATSATLTGLVTRANYTVQVRAVNGNGPGLWSESNYFRVGPTHEVCEIIDQLTLQPLNPPQPASAQQLLSNTPAEGGLRIDGIPELGQTLSADTTAIEDADGLESAVFQYQWLAEDADIAGATGSTYSLTSGDVGKAIEVRVTFTDDAGNGETLTSAPTVVTAAGLQLQSATVDGAILTLTYSEVLDTGGSLPQAAFAVNVNGEPRSLIGVAVGQSNVLLLLSSPVEAGDTVTVDYTVPDGPDFIRDIRSRKAASFSGQAVTNDTATDPDDTAKDPDETASAPLAASVHNVPSSHNGQDAFTFELRFSENPQPDFSYTTVRDHAFTVTGGSVTYVRRLEPGRNVRWEITVTPGSGADVAIALNATTDCAAQGAICAEGGRMLFGGLKLVVPGPTTPATGLPSISGAALVGETLTAGTTGISDGDGLDNAAFAYQWLADDADIAGATGSSYTLVDADAGKAIKVRVSFTDDAGNGEQLTSAVTGAVAAAPPPNTLATGLPSITGTAQVGDTLTAVTSGIEDADGLDNATFNHQWLADDAEITGATGGSYILADADEGKTIKVQVSFTDDGGNDEILTSVATAAVAPKPNSPATGAPTISGTTQAGETLTSSTTGIADGDGLTSATFTYQWLADDADIAGATGSSYTLVGADEGKAIKVRASFTDDGGNQESLTSEPTAAVAEAAPTEPPPAPQNLTAVVNGDGHIVLSWAAPDGGRVTGYRILRRRPALGEDVLLEYVANTRSTAATFTDTNVTPGVQHVYRVQAISAAGQSQRSNYVNVTP